MEKLKIGIIEPIGGHAGMDYYDYGLVKGLVENQREVFLYTCDRTVAPEEYKNNTVLCFRNIYGSRPALIRAIAYVIGIIYAGWHSMLRGVKIHHYHFFHAGLMELASIIISTIFFRKIVITLHDLSSLVGDDSTHIKRFIYRRARTIIVQTKTCEKEINAAFPEFMHKVVVIKPGNYCHVIQHIDSAQAKEKLGLPVDKKLVLFFGQIKKVKGLDVLIKAVTHLAKERSDFVFVIAGRVWKDDLCNYQELIERGGIQAITKFDQRFIPNEEVDYFYNAADIICVPYRKSYYSAVLLMGMSYQKAVIASDLSIFQEVVKDGVDGMLFRDGDHVDLAEKLSVMLSSESLMQSISGNAHQRMTTDFSWARVGADLVSAYERW